MDWSRAKTILICLFLILNIFLLITNEYTSSTIRFATDYTRQAREFLASRDIKLDTSVPDISGKIGTIAYTHAEFDFNKLDKSVFDKNYISGDGDTNSADDDWDSMELSDNEVHVTYKLENASELFNDIAAFSQRALKYAEGLGYKKRDLYPISQEKSEASCKLVYVVKYKGALLFEQVISFELEPGGILRITFPARVVKRINAPSEILSAYQVLVMAALPKGSVVTGVDFGYRQLDEGEFYDTPVWRIVLDNGQSMFYNAYTGEKLIE